MVSGTFDLSTYLLTYAGAHFDELVSADYAIMVSDTYDALGYVDGSDEVPSDEAQRAVGLMEFWIRDMSVVVGDKDAYARAKNMYEVALARAFQYISVTEYGSIRSIRLRGTHYHQADYYFDEADYFDPYDPVP
jgi:hypothetical protein